MLPCSPMLPATPITRQPPRRWDIFCRVVDNFGDIGVCWRLARQLVAEHGLAVRLWVDDLASLTPLCPVVDAKVSQQTVAGVDLRHWPAEFPALAPGELADIVIEAFACELPAAYLQAMATAPRTPGWINLEYLSAEPWVESCHGVASPHPTLPLLKHFFFPGFSPKTGGLLREAELAPPPPPPRCEHLEISLFCYDGAPLAPLISAWATHPQPIHARVAAGKAQAAVARHFGHAGPWAAGNLRLSPQPFLPQPEYDALLRDCDLNLVRGEDSFVRAQWAERPLLWHIYPQQENAHLDKLEAFLECYGAALPPGTAATQRALFHSWNGDGLAIPTCWPAFAAELPTLTRHAASWAGQLRQLGNLAENLVKFCTYAI